MTLTPSQQTRFVDFINKHGISGDRYDFAFTVYKLACAQDSAADVAKEAAIRLELENQRAKQYFESGLDWRDEEILALHRKIATETLRADQGWQRYESANADRNALRAAMVQP